MRKVPSRALFLRLRALREFILSAAKDLKDFQVIPCRTVAGEV